MIAHPFEMAQHRFRALPFLWLCVAGYIGGVWLFHERLSQFVAILGTVSSVSAICLTVMVVRAHMQNGHAAPLADATQQT